MGDKSSKEAVEEVRVDSVIHDADFSTDLRSTGFQTGGAKSKGHGDWGDSRMSFNQSAKRTLKVQLPSGRVETISFYPEERPTVGWLCSEYCRLALQDSPNKPLQPHEVVLCATTSDLYTDYLLADFSEHLEALPEGAYLQPYPGYTVPGSITLKDISILKNIGIGGFSKVFLVRRNDNGRFYALKFVSKKDMKKNGKEEYAFNEKKLLSKLRHKFINRFVFSFQTPSYLCFGLEYCQGGSLYELLKKQKSFDEETVRICIAQIALAMSYLHSKGVIYRDLKAENILIDKRGNCKMCDFGLSKKVHNVQDMNETFCGSPDYLSPEVVRKEGYNYLRDIFSMGVLAYELLHGTTPFFSDDLKEIYRKIKHEQPVIRKPVSADCKRFILACLEKNQDQRLGAVNGMVEVLCHPWLRTIVYSINKENNKLSPFQPYIPKKPVLTSSSPSLNFLNEFYQNGDSPTRQAILPTRYFDFSFRLSQDNPQEFPDVEDAHFQPHDSDMYKMNDTSTISTKAKIKMASNINILS